MSTDPTSETVNQEVELPTTELDEAVFNMSLMGMSQRAIAAETGISKTQVHRIVKRMHETYVPERYADMNNNLAHELGILDVLTRANMIAAAQGSKNAADIVLDCHVRRCKLLGLENASKIEVTLKTQQDLEIERLMDLMTSAAPAQDDLLR